MCIRDRKESERLETGEQREREGIEIRSKDYRAKERGLQQEVKPELTAEKGIRRQEEVRIEEKVTTTSRTEEKVTHPPNEKQYYAKEIHTTKEEEEPNPRITQTSVRETVYHHTKDPHVSNITQPDVPRTNQ
eukprot:TRINITY_DN14166_c0_g1_i2.p1 TRINITY_DN14166_c0_g1~~TRINITY_DN14166_c0_g1_i2.p1  ORF type:complete len:151 (-),score=49.82 TRINITY_DN14166_c0_g1_i2:90-485(-)